MKTLSVLFTLAAILITQPEASAQRGSGGTRGSSDGGSSRGSDYSTRGDTYGSSSGSSGSSSGSSGSSSSDWGGGYSGGCYDCYSGGGGVYIQRERNTKFRDLDIDMKVRVIHLGENGVITELYKRFLSANVCVELEKTKEEICGLKPRDLKVL